ncbi:MAG: SAM-dependent methyltransferase, partial [Planctomycetota bacterium]|nr:SAM-dependent methyltransferase [Planctomycetota bacterium]
MDQEIRNKLRNVVTQCRKLLEDSISQELEGKYAIFAKKNEVTADPGAKMAHLSDEDQQARREILDHLQHIQSSLHGDKYRTSKQRTTDNGPLTTDKSALDQLIREIAFTHLNRLCAYKMMEAREVYVGGQKFREAVSRGVNSNGVKFYLAEHPEEERLFNTGHQDVAYRHFLDWLGGALSDEIGVLFSPTDPANRLYPRQKTLDDVLDLLNGGGLKPEETELREQWPLIWAQDETIGWVYQYFTPKELRDQARKESQAPRNSYELAFRNQFFTPRYVVEFLTDNTLGRIWYEMRKGDTKLKGQCLYMVRRPTEIFLASGECQLPASPPADDLTREELLKLPVHIPHRPKKDPRDLKILDPACGSGHFLLYCFDLLLTIYEEAYADPDLGPALQDDYPTLEGLRRDVPRLILAHNLHGIDIDLRA